MNILDLSRRDLRLIGPNNAEAAKLENLETLEQDNKILKLACAILVSIGIVAIGLYAGHKSKEKAKEQRPL